MPLLLLNQHELLPFFFVQGCRALKLLIILSSRVTLCFILNFVRYPGGSAANNYVALQLRRFLDKLVNALPIVVAFSVRTRKAHHIFGCLSAHTGSDPI